MITTSDQVFLSLPLPADPRCINLVLTGGTLKVETIEEYLERVVIEDRYLGLEAIICGPPGNYSINTFMNNASNGTIYYSTYIFNDLTDPGFIENYPNGTVVVNNLTTGGIYKALSAEQGVVLKSLTDRYIHDQGLSSNTWEINHNLDRYPSVTIVDSTKRVVEGSVIYVDTNNIIITFNAGFSGKAILN